MCGIYGMASLTDRPLAHPELLPAMGASLRHRGPDSSKVMTGERVALGCERLRIVDLLERADQPFRDPARRYWVTCNGEIYNARDLRSRYAGFSYASHSDVEPILPLMLDRGEAGVAELDGMFGLAVWDDQAGSLLLGRDRAGEKPLFFARIDGEVWFASEIQALLVHPHMARRLDEAAVAEYLRWGYVPAPRTAFEGIHKVPAGTTIRFTRGGEVATRYWRPEALVAEGQAGGADVEELSALLEAAVHKQLASDVPVGVFVSGGIDSALIATLAARASDQRLHSYVARFADASFDESRWAEQCARLAGTHHHEIVIDQKALAEAFEVVIDSLAEPLADPAILPTYLLARRAREDVRVVLGGEGADELFGGYPTYLGHRLNPYFQALPRSARRALGAGISRLSASRGRVPIEFLIKRFIAYSDQPWAQRHAGWFGVDAASFLREPQQVDLPGAACDCSIEGLGDAERAMLFDYFTYLPDDLLVKTDRATMLCSIEARSPFLDRDLTRFALALPPKAKIRRFETKHLLKKAARQWLPEALVSRRKRGLSVPVARWMDQGLEAEVDRLLDPARLERQALFDSPAVGAALVAHRSGRANLARPLWAIVCLQRWLERWIPDRADPQGT